MLDEQGWVLVGDILDAIRTKHPELDWVDIESLELIQQQNDKQRFEILEGSIRARYGHSLPDQRIVMIPHVPPAMLYHGTTEKAAELIRQFGLQPQQRHYVHLSLDIPTAIMAGKRRTKTPVLFLINAEAAFAAGIQFYKGNETIWLANNIPPCHLSGL